MFSKKIYRCKCSVCGKEHDVESVFLSSPIMLLGDDGKTALSMHSCGAHTGEEIRAAYDRLVRS